MRHEMPSELWQFYQKDGYFFMDHGDIYYGCFVDFHEFPDQVFIVQPSNRRRLLEMHRDERTLEVIKSLAWELRDFSKIKYYAEGKQDIGNTHPHIDLTRYGNQQWKKMFVFGAGASAFSVFEDDLQNFRKSDYCPPIANELFGRKFKHHIKKYPGVELSLSSLKAFANDVEAFFEDEWRGLIDTHNPSVAARHINICFYLQELFQKISEETVANFYDCNLYSLFTDKIQKYLAKNRDDKFAFVSFNYDTILDNYLSRFFSAPFSNLDDYINFNKNPFFLFKPHGSCNWGWRFSDDFLKKNIKSIPQFLFDNQTTFSQLYFEFLGSPYEMMYQQSWGHELELSDHTNGKFTVNKNKIEVISNGSNLHFPSLLIPYKDKDEMVMPYHHYSMLKWFINEMEDLYLIGWKGNEAAFNRLLKNQANRLKRIFIVNPNLTEVETYLSKHLDLKKYEIIHFKSFEAFVMANIT